MRRFGWTRLACLFLILTVLTALVRLGGGGAEARSLAARVPDALVVSSTEPEPTVTRLTDAQISSLEDARGEPATGGNARSAEPPLESSLTGPAGTTGQPSGMPARTVPAGDPPVFYRPSRGPDVAERGPVCGDLRGTPAGARVVFPLERRFFYSYDDTWGAPRTQGGHEGTDLMTPMGVPEYAITDGTVVPVAGSDANGWNSLGGNAVMLRADYSVGPVRAGDLYYYAHLRHGSPLEVGDRVAAGQVVGYSGDTGQGPPGTSGLFPPHLHLGWYDGTGGRQQATSGAMNPYPLLEWIKANGGAVSGGSDARFCEAPQAGPPTPSSGGAWPTPSDPGMTPDLDTSTGNPSPTRAERGDRNATPPATDPASPDRPEKNPSTNPAKPPPNRPDNQPQRPTPSENDPAEPAPAPAPAPPPPGGQYDPSTGEAAPPPRPPAPDQGPKPKPHREPGKNEKGPTPKRDPKV